MDCEKERIWAELILKVRFGTATREEECRLEKWLTESERHRSLYERIVSGRSISERVKLEEEVAQDVDLIGVSGLIRERLQANKFNRRRRIYRWISLAGAACILGVAVLFFVPSRETGKNSEKNLAVVESEKKVVEDKVVLVLANGDEVGLTSRGRDSISAGGVAIVREDERLTYKRLENMPDTVVRVEEWNKIVTAAGGEYSFVLSDGTRVWLNAESELEFPVDFVGKERVVRLKGEAYFEVERDEDFPFIVEAGDTRTRVLGTSFNVKAYEEDEAVSTTLLTGKVELSSVRGEGNAAILTPGMQGTWMKTGGEIQVRKVATDKVMAWREGLFLFDNEKLSEVIKILERWYGVSFVYDKAKDKEHVFSGSFSKDEPLNGILDILTYAGGPKFKMVGNVVEVID